MWLNFLKIMFIIIITNFVKESNKKKNAFLLLYKKMITDFGDFIIFLTEIS